MCNDETTQQDNDLFEKAKEQNKKECMQMTTTNEPQIFSYYGKSVRTVLEDGEPRFIAKDVCDVFGETNRNRAMQTLDEDEKGYTFVYTNFGLKQCATVTEAGLYSLLFAMQPSKARGVSDEYITERQQKLRQFKRWVTHEVLPQIRKHGAYVTPVKTEEILNNPDALIEMLNAIKRERAEKERLQFQKDQLKVQIEEYKPKAVLADAISVTQDTILIRDLAKILKTNGIETGEKRLFEQLRQQGFLIKKDGADFNSPTQKAMELGLFTLTETAIVHHSGITTISKTSRVTGKGQLYFLNYFLNQNGGSNETN
ncbi:antirepressor [Alphaproteobacteria bacterium]|nr:antirepressor [Alphaproteobacteria bacterium]